MGNLFSGKKGEKIFSQSDVLEQTAGTYGQDFDHAPFPSKKTKEELLAKINFNKIDRAALDAPPELLLEQFWDISDHLIVSKSFEVIDDIYRIRALFRWMTSFDIDSIMTQILPLDFCPLEYLLKIQSDFGDHAHLLYVLCVAANIPCVVINGMTKHGFYEVGDELDRDALLSKWNAVFINGNWWLIDPHWASSVVEGTYRDQIFVDEAGNISVTDELGNKDGMDRPVNEFFFLCDPKKLIWTHFPDDPKWQLLEEPIDLQRFKEQPYLREYFHNMEMNISKSFPETDKCVLRPDGRPSRIAFDLPQDKGKNYTFKFTVSEVDVDLGSERDPRELERNIMMEKTDKQVRFTARFPYKGKFQLDIYGCDESSEKAFRLLCSYLIHCGKPCGNYRGFPKIPEHGWGPHPLAEQIGLVPISPKSNVIQTDNGIVEVRLPAQMCNNMCHALKSMNIDDAILTNHAVGRFDNDQYFVNMRLPEQGEYTLEIFADVDALRGKLPDTNVMTFLIEFYNDVTNPPFPVVLGSHLGAKPGAKKLNIEALESPNGVVMAWEGKLTLQFKAAEQIQMFNELSSTDTVSKKMMKVKDRQESDKWVYDLDLPIAGIYSLNLYSWDNNEGEKKMHEVFSYLIQSTGYITKEELEARRKGRKKRRSNRSSSRSPRRTEDPDSKNKGIDPTTDTAIIETADANDPSRIKDSDQMEADPFMNSDNLILNSKAAPVATSFARTMSSEGSKRGVKNPEGQTDGQQMSGTEGDGQRKKNPVSLRGKTSTNQSNGLASNRNEKASNSGLGRSKTQSSMTGDGTTKGSVSNSENNNKVVGDKSKNAKIAAQSVSQIQSSGRSAQAQKTRNAKGKSNSTDKNKSVSFGSETMGALKVKTYVTSENIVQIPIEQALNTVFTSMRRRDANEKHGDKAVVVKRNDGLEVRIKGYGEYQLDVMWKGEGADITMVGRYTVIRKPQKGLKKTQSETYSTLFGSGFVDASVWDSDGTKDRKKKNVKATETEEKEPDRIIPDLRSIKSSDMFGDDMQERFTEATNREMMAKLRKSMNVKDLGLVLKYMELYHSTTKSARNAFPPSLQNMIKKIKQHQKVVMECRMEEPVVIEETVDIKKRSDEKGMLEITIVVAHKIIDRLTRKEKRSKIELEINQIALTEIKQYSSPPEGVHECIMATLLLLGDNIEELKDFSACQGLLFRTGEKYIMRRIARFNVNSVPEETVGVAKGVLENYSIWQIMDVSKGAAAFFMWVRAMLQEIENRKRPSTRMSRCTTAKSRSSKRIPPRATEFPEYISRRDGTIIMKL